MHIQIIVFIKCEVLHCTFIYKSHIVYKHIVANIFYPLHTFSTEFI